MCTLSLFFLLDFILVLLYTYTSYNESITIQSIPIFYLEPNTRINVRDTESDIYGDYVISTNTETKVPGLYVIGDSRTKKYSQVTIATADGTIAALNAIEYLNG